MSLLEVTKLAAFYGDFQALFSVDLHIEAGEAIDKLLGATKSRKLATAKVLTEYLPSRRPFWARLCATSALVFRRRAAVRATPTLPSLPSRRVARGQRHPIWRRCWRVTDVPRCTAGTSPRHRGHSRWHPTGPEVPNTRRPGIGAGNL